MDEHPIYPGCHWPEFTRFVVEGEGLWQCTDCGCISDLQSGTFNRHSAHCPRVPYLLREKQGRSPTITWK
jgi:uncharacterized paraquat-inducible protein A